MRASMWPVLLLAACGSSGPREEAPALSGESIEGLEHPDAKLAVSYGREQFLVDISFIDLLDKSVIVVRRDEPSPAERQPFTLEETVPVPGGMPFSASGYGPVAVAIADQLAGRLGLCPEAGMELDRNLEGGARTMFRDERQAWVVFAVCPPG